MARKRGAIVATVKLEQPIQNGADIYEEINFEKPKLFHIKALDSIDGATAKFEELVSQIGAVPYAVAEELSLIDMANINEALAPFLVSTRLPLH